MLGLGLGLTKGGFIPNFAKTIYKQYVVRVTAAGGVFQNAVCALNRLLGLNSQSLLKQASLVLIPDGIKEDVVFSQVPTTGAGDFVFSRASDATYTDAGGVVRRSPYNLVTYSEMFSDVSWVKTSSTITANTISAPNGTLTADTLTASSSFPRVVQNPTIQANQSYRISTYAKAGSASVFTIFVSVNAVTLVNNVQYNLSTGVVTGSGTMQDVGNGWYLCSATFTVGASTASPDIRFFNHAQGVTGGWSGTNFFYAWGAQFVEGTEALPYFPTTTRLNVPRIDYRNADGSLSTVGRLLLEPQRSNVLTYSDQFDNAIWTKGTTTVTANTDISPDGTQNADRMTIVDSTSRISQALSLGAGTYTISVYVRVISTTTAGIVRLNSTVDSVSTNFFFTPTSQWARYTTTVTAATGFTAIALRGTSPGFVGTLAVWGFQVETGAYATSYIPTLGAAVTRNADSASRTGVSSWIGQTEGTVFVDVNYQAVTGLSMFVSIRPNSANKIEIYRDGTTIFGDIFGNSVNVLLSRVSNPAGRYKIALAYKSGQTALYINGTSAGTSATAFSFATSMADLSINLRSGPTFIEQAFYNQVMLFPNRLTDSQLQSLTTL